MGNPLLREPLRPDHIKPRLLGHWGTTPGLNFIYAHLNRAILARNLDMIYVMGPGHGGPGPVAAAWLEAPTAKSIPTSPKMNRACAACSLNSPSPAEYPATLLRRPPDPSTKEANSVLAVPRVRRCIRQPRPRGRSGHRRRRSRNRTTRRELAFQQIRRSAPRRGRTSDPAPQRIQDRQSHTSRPHRRRRTRITASWIRTRTDHRLRSRTRPHAPALRRRARSQSRSDHRDPARGTAIRPQ